MAEDKTEERRPAAEGEDLAFKAFEDDLRRSAMAFLFGRRSLSSSSFSSPNDLLSALDESLDKVSTHTKREGEDQ